jgi:hypothetical protein
MLLRILMLAENKQFTTSANASTVLVQSPKRKLTPRHCTVFLPVPKEVEPIENISLDES